MLVDLTLKSSRVLVIGAGRVGLRRARTVLDECGDVTLVSNRFTAAARRLSVAGVRLVKADVEDGQALAGLLRHSDLVIVATNDYGLNRKIARLARRTGAMVAAVDDPSDSDFNFPAVRAVGNIRVGVTTGGRSPTMARVICKRLAASITKEERLRVELLNHARIFARKRLPTPAVRRAAVYKVLDDRRVTELLRLGRLSEAKAAAEAVVEGK